jgi:hypothetical protein
MGYGDLVIPWLIGGLYCCHMGFRWCSNVFLDDG